MGVGPAQSQQARGDGLLLAYAPFEATDGLIWYRLPERAGRSTSIQAAKNECRLVQYEVRRYTAWSRYITLAMLAHSFAAGMAGIVAAKRAETVPVALVALTVAEAAGSLPFVSPPNHRAG